jgi:hypothetical protein
MTAARYAAGTEVSSDRSRAEIERTLTRYGATQFLYGWSGKRATVGFTAHGRSIRFELPLPDRADKEFTRTDTGRERSEQAAADAYEKAVRQRWRALALVVKAKLEAVSSGITTFEDEFLAHTVLPGGVTVADTVRNHVAQAYKTGSVPALLPDYRRSIEAGGNS